MRADTSLSLYPSLIPSLLVMVHLTLALQWHLHHIASSIQTLLPRGLARVARTDSRGSAATAAKPEMTRLLVSYHTTKVKQSLGGKLRTDEVDVRVHTTGSDDQLLTGNCLRGPLSLFLDCDMYGDGLETYLF